MLRGVPLPAGFPVFIVDAFTGPRVAGNPAGVVVRDDARPDAWSLRWFSPIVEVVLCGHATLAAAHVLWETGRLAAGKPARFATRSGELTALRLRDGRI